MTTPKNNAAKEEDDSAPRKAKATTPRPAKAGTAARPSANSTKAKRGSTKESVDSAKSGTGSGRPTSGKAQPGAGSAKSTQRTPSKSSGKPRQKVSAATGRRATAHRPTTARRRQVAQEAANTEITAEHFTPAWVRHTLAGVVIIVFAAAFYFLCIQPYAYRWKPCYGLKGYGVCLPSGFTVHGIDISHYQGDVDWTALTADDGRPFPLNFVFMKATEGGDHVDDRFADNFRQAREHGLIRGAYHYFLPQSDPVRQAESFIRTVSLEPGDLPPVLDVETTGRRSDEELQQAIATWMDRVERHYGVRPILYTSYKFRTRHLDTPALDAYPYWIAHYYVDSVRYQGPWHFWQHTDVGDVPGIRASVDLNVFRGTLQQLRDLTLPDPTTEQQPSSEQ